MVEQLKQQLNDLYTQKRRSRGVLTPSQKKRESALIKISNILLNRVGNSTCWCNFQGECLTHKKLVKQGLIKPSERSPDLDLVWIPWYEEWVCVKCYEKYYKHMTLEEFIRSKSHPDLGLDNADLMYLIQKYRDSFKYKD